jgi:uncharacterized membrane protein required for colicin V production
MEFFFQLNILDYLLIFVVFIGALMGMVRGTVAQLVSAGSIWLALVLALWFYKPFSSNILQGLDFLKGAKAGTDTFSFVLMLILFYHAVKFGISKATTAPEEKRKKKKKRKRKKGEDDFEDPIAGLEEKGKKKLIGGPVEAIGGFFLGILLTVVWTAIFLGAIQFFFSAQLPSIGGQTVGGNLGSSTQSGIVGNLETSLLRHQFNQVLWLLVTSVDLFVPNDATILKKVLSVVTGTGAGG